MTTFNLMKVGRLLFTRAVPLQAAKRGGDATYTDDFQNRPSTAYAGNVISNMPRCAEGVGSAASVLRRRLAPLQSSKTLAFRSDPFHLQVDIERAAVRLTSAAGLRYPVTAF